MSALQRTAIPEGVMYLTRAQELLRELPEAERRSGVELMVLATRGYSLAHGHGFDSPEAARTMARALALLRPMDEFPPLVELGVWSLHGYHQMRAESPLALELAERVVRQGERQENLELLTLGSQMLATDLTGQGRPRLALASSERALACARSGLAPHWKAAGQAAKSPATIQAFATLSLSLLGRLEQARRYAREAVEQARRTGPPHVLTMALSCTAKASQFRRDVQETARWAEEALPLSGERSYWRWKVWERVIQGWTLAELGQPREGSTLIGQEIARWREWGARRMLPYFLGLHAEVYLKLGQLRAGLRVVNEGLREGQATGERYFEAELYRLRGELLRGTGQEREARHDFSQAIAVAREQEALLFELRATVSLGRLLRDTGRPEVVPRLLTRLLTRFEVGEDSVDLTEARALLEGRSAEWGDSRGAAPR